MDADETRFLRYKGPIIDAMLEKEEMYQKVFDLYKEAEDKEEFVRSLIFLLLMANMGCLPTYHRFSRKSSK